MRHWTRCSICGRSILRTTGAGQRAHYCDKHQKLIRKTFGNRYGFSLEDIKKLEELEELNSEEEEVKKMSKYTDFVKKEMKAGKSMKEAAKNWKKCKDKK